MMAKNNINPMYTEKYGHKKKNNVRGEMNILENIFIFFCEEKGKNRKDINFQKQKKCSCQSKLHDGVVICTYICQVGHDTFH